MADKTQSTDVDTPENLHEQIEMLTKSGTQWYQNYHIALGQISDLETELERTRADLEFAHGQLAKVREVASEVSGVGYARDLDAADAVRALRR